MLANSKWDETMLESYRRHMAGMVTGIDFAVEDIVKGLENAGILDDTLLIISSDHGDFNGDHGLVSKIMLATTASIMFH